MNFPGTSLICGLLANALGWCHHDRDKTQALQQRLLVAARADLPGHRLTDYQTADLGQAFLIDTGWTTRHQREDRTSGSSKTGTHIRLRDYIADSAYTVAVALSGDEQPGLDRLQSALNTPARPLFIGRKTCIPTSPILLLRTQAASLRKVLENVPRHVRAESGPIQAWWPGQAIADNEQQLEVADLRDWYNNIHTGRRQVCAGMVDPPEAT
jgi:CRISPR system Cascade subunit CasD